MNINQMNSLYQSKVTEIKQRLPETVSVQNKFQELLEKVQLSNSTETATSTQTSESNESDPVNLLNSLIATQSTLNTSSLFSSSNQNNLFPTSSLNNSLLTLQQNALLKSLTTKTED